MDDFISTKIGRTIEDTIVEALVETSSKAQVQLWYLAKDYDRDSQELFVLRKSLQSESREKHKPEEILPEQSENIYHLSVHVTSTNTGRCILK